MAVGLDHRRINPADIAVGAAINQIDTAMSSVTEHDHRRARKVSSITASLTESRFRVALDSAMMTGFHSVISSSRSCDGAAMT
jgi:hypothetical protein